jgi:hypothetical protein
MRAIGLSVRCGLAGFAVTAPAGDAAAGPGAIVQHKGRYVTQSARSQAEDNAALMVRGHPFFCSRLSRT